VKPLHGEVAIVTGVSSPVGIGAAVARRLAGSGARLVLAADAPPDPIAQECAHILGESQAVVPLTVDLGDPTSVAAMVAEAEKRFGRVDLLVNNAAVRINRSSATSPSRNSTRPSRSICARPFLASQAVLPSMRRQGGGRIVHIASQLGSVAYQTRTIYGMTKAALIHLAKSMALELAADNIQVNTVSPGPVATQPILDRQQKKPEESARTPRLRPDAPLRTSEEIGEVVHWLLTTGRLLPDPATTSSSMAATRSTRGR
jgi:NAD(P)-dependent dehydrogenase (short-subunit alcohol dehydrogenase family)